MQHQCKNCILYEEHSHLNISNFGLPGVIDLPTAKRLPDGELIITQQIHKNLARTGLSFQALPSLGFTFRYSGHGSGGSEANDRVNHDRSFDAHISILNENRFFQLYQLDFVILLEQDGTLQSI